MDNTASEAEYFDELSEKPSKKRKTGMKDEEFVKCLQSYPCLLEKSQTPDMKIRKQAALEAMEEKIKKNHGVNLSISQIRKKLENMKARVKSKGIKKRTGNLRRMLKDHEKQLLIMMDYQNNSVLNDTPDVQQCNVSVSSKDPDEDERLVVKEEEILGPSNSSTPQFRQFSSPERNPNDQCSILDLQKEILLEQKEINRQKRNLNSQQQEIFALQKEKLLLEIELLNKKKNILQLL